MMACMFRTNPLKCVPICVPKMKIGVPKELLRCALEPC